MTARRAITIAGAVVVLTAALGSTLAQGGTQKQSGKIAFSRYRFVDSPIREEIWDANPDGSVLRRLSIAPANYVDIQPDWAPGGQHLIFTRCAPVNGVPHEGRCTIWRVDASGGGLQMLSTACNKLGPTCTDDGAARYSPDGRSIALLRFDGVSGTIAITDANLSDARSLYPFGNESGVPDIDALAWSPDGKKLAFTVHNDNGTRFKPVGGRALFVIGVDGTGLRRVTRWKVKAGRELDWSPDGKHIVFSSVACCADTDPGPPGGNLYTIRPDGTHLRQLTHIARADGVELGSYSPDGKWIVFTTSAHATPWPNGERAWPDVFKIRADGRGLARITHTKNWEGEPVWGR